MSDVVDCSLTLLQALNDQDSNLINDLIKSKTVKLWINKTVALKQIKNSRVRLDDDSEYDTCLTYASYYNDALTVRQLVEAGADVTITNSSYNTPLNRACWSEIDAKEKVAFLLQRNASLIAAQSKRRNSPLHNAALRGNVDVITLLLQYGAEVNNRRGHDRTALHHACQEGHEACIHVLMKHGADVEARDSEHQLTPLHLAAAFNRINCVKTLIQNYGASINSRDKFGQTPLRYAAQAGHQDVVKLLKSYPAHNGDARDVDVARTEGSKGFAGFLGSLLARGVAAMAEVTSTSEATITTDSAAVASVTSAMAARNITDDSKRYTVISDKVLHKIARMIGAKRLALGLELDLESAVIETLESEHREPSDHAFYILKTWREMTGNKAEKDQVDMLEEALREIGRNDLQSYIGR